MTDKSHMIDITQLWPDPDWDASGYCAHVEVDETFRPEVSRLLGPDGNPLPYEQFKIGFQRNGR